MTPLPKGREAVADALLGARGDVVVCAHERPDGDAVGSVLGLVRVLRSLGIAARGVLADEGTVSPAYASLPGVAELVPADDSTPCDALVALDTTDVGRLGLAAPLASTASTVIVIDHHPDNSGFGTHSWVDPDAPAVGLMIWELLDALDVQPDAQVADCLYLALMTDTGRFQHDNTTARAFRVAGQMVEAGANAADLARDVYQSRSPGATALLSTVLSRSSLENDGAVVYSWLCDDDLASNGVLPSETEDLIDWIRMTAGPRVAVLAKVTGDDTRLSLRAKDDFDVGAVARVLGGGGHRAAAGVTVSGDLDRALAVLLPLLPGSLG